MNEIMDERNGDVNQSPNNQEHVLNVKDDSPLFEDEFNSTFTKLEAMQEEIVLTKIEELERRLSDIEAFVLKIIDEEH